MSRRKLFFFFSVLVLVSSNCFSQGAESITLSTYYPSPYGVYKTLRLFPSGTPATCLEGEMYYDNGLGAVPSGIYFCGSGLSWESSSSGELWSSSGGSLYANDINWDVGIGTVSPNAKLDVNGRVNISTGAGVDTGGILQVGGTTTDNVVAFMKGIVRIDGPVAGPAYYALMVNGGASTYQLHAGNGTRRLRLGYNHVNNWGNIQSGTGTMGVDFAYTELYLQNNGGRVTIGSTMYTPAEKLYVAGHTTIAGNLTVTGVTTGGPWVDISEYIPSTKSAEAGDVVVVDTDNDSSVIPCSMPYDMSVAGIVSTNPGYLLGVDKKNGNEGDVKLALCGRVPCKVTTENGHIKRGDLLTTSSKPGYAMKAVFLDVREANDLEELKKILSENEKRRNAILGKALEPLEEGEGQIEVLVTLQ